MRKMISIVLVVILFVSGSVLTKNIWDSYKKIERLGETEKKEHALKKETEELREELEYRNSKDFIEKEARNKLGLSKKGEAIYVIEGESSDGDDLQQDKKENLANWRLWLEVFVR
jgi:cell division protein FtsB